MSYVPRAMLCATFLAASACGDSRPSAERVEAFCAQIRGGERIETALARFEEYDLQPSGVAQSPAERLAGTLDAEALTTISSVLAEPLGSPAGARPVCAIYYSNQMKGGDDRVILAEFKREWAARY
jgi:hypothetical protein